MTFGSILRHRSLPALAALVAIVFTLPSLRVGWVADDYYQRWLITGAQVYPEIGRPPLDMFCFFDGDPHRTNRMMQIGLAPWWTFPQIKGCFWKPLTALSHIADYRIWPDHPALMHAQSLAWFGLLIFSVGLFYRRIMRRTLAAGLATVLYAVDYSHATPAAWLANRNSVMAGLFGVMAIAAHHRYRHDGKTVYCLAAPTLLAMSLFSAEAGIAAAAYIAAYALALDRGPWLNRAARLIPYIAVIGIWRMLWNQHGGGVLGMDDFYADPAASPSHFIALILTRGPLLLLGQFALPPAELHLALNASAVSEMVFAGVLVSLAMLYLFLPVLRRSSVARFWLVGMLLAIIPICAAAPMNRHLIFIGIGAMGLLGQCLASAGQPGFWKIRSMPSRAGCGILVALMVFIHLIFSPVALAVLARYPVGPQKLLASFHNIPDMTAADSDKDLIILNHPLPAEILHMLCDRIVDHQVLPRTTRILAPAGSALSIRRLDANSIVITADTGYFATPTGGLLYSKSHPLIAGRPIELKPLTITPLNLTADGRPSQVLYHFDVPLEDVSLHWIFWQSGAFHAFKPLDIGATMQIPGSGLPF